MVTDSRQLLTKAHEAETKGMAGTRAVRAGDLGSHAEVRQVEQSEVAGHQGREGLPAPSLFAMTAVLGCRLSSACKGFQLQGWSWLTGTAPRMWLRPVTLWS